MGAEKDTNFFHKQALFVHEVFRKPNSFPSYNFFMAPLAVHSDITRNIYFKQAMEGVEKLRSLIHSVFAKRIDKIDKCMPFAQKEATKVMLIIFLQAQSEQELRRFVAFQFPKRYKTKTGRRTVSDEVSLPV